MSDKRKQNTAKVGRPTSITRHKFEILQEAFKNGATTQQALLLSKVSKDAYYYNMQNNESFHDKIEACKNWVTIKAKENIAKKIAEGDDTETSKWWVERREKDLFSTKTEKEVTNTNIIGYVNLSELPKESKNVEIEEIETPKLEE